MQLGPAAAARRSSLEDHRFPCPACGSDLRFDPGQRRAEVPALRPRGGDPRARAARSPSSTCARSRRARCRRPRCRRPASRAARAAARRSSSGSTSTPANARSAPRRSSPTPARTGRSSRRRSCRSCSSEDEGAGGDERLARPALVRALRPQGSTPAPSARCRGSTSPTGPTTPRPAPSTPASAARSTTRRRPVTVVVNGRRQTAMQQVARIRWQPVRGQVARDFDDVLVLGSTSLPKRFTDALAPWDLSALTAYEPKLPRRLPRRGLHRAGRGGLRARRAAS